VALGTSSETTARLGLKGKRIIISDSGQVWQPRVRANFWSGFGSTAATLFGPDRIPLISHAQYMDVDAGFTTKIDTHFSAFAKRVISSQSRTMAVDGATASKASPAHAISG